jgi:hypothetical protein
MPNKAKTGGSASCALKTNDAAEMANLIDNPPDM